MGFRSLDEVLAGFTHIWAVLTCSPETPEIEFLILRQTYFTCYSMVVLRILVITVLNYPHSRNKLDNKRPKSFIPICMTVGITISSIGTIYLKSCSLFYWQSQLIEIISSWTGKLTLGYSES